MKRIFFLSGFFLFTLGFSSCACDCVGPNDNNPSNKECKTAYENLHGEGTWASYEASAKNSGYVCK
jgi:hypothetical protein